MSNHQTSPSGSNPSEKIDLSGLDFKSPSMTLYDEDAQKAAECVAHNIVGLGKTKLKEANKPTQLRRFYDELLMWEQRIRNKPSAYPEYLPMIKMLNAKVAYAHGRKLVDKNYHDLIREGLRQLSEDNPETYYHFRLFMEAFMGFYKMEKGN